MTSTARHSDTTDFTGELNFATVADYVALLKPRVMSLVLFTGVAGLVVAPGRARIRPAHERGLTVRLVSAVAVQSRGMTVVLERLAEVS